jgi:hypothetical protein
MPSRRPRPRHTHALTHALACLLLPLALLACEDDPVSQPARVSPLEVLAVQVRIDPDTIALGDTAWVTVTLHNPSSLSLATATTDGCPLFEPVVRTLANEGALRPFVATCLDFRSRDDVEPARTAIALAPDERVELRLPFTGTAIDARADGRCNVTGRFEIALVLGARDDVARFVSQQPGGRGGMAAARGVVVVPAGGLPGAPPCT